jgi:uncharacterized tellurite resistance protein B-like protein
MACDGNIDKREVSLIKKMHQENKIFGALEINNDLDNLLTEINNRGIKFIRDFFNELTSFELNEQEELSLIRIAIETIRADEKVEYSEIKFFKVIRSKLKISNEKILSIHSDFEEFLEQDIISESYLTRLQDDFFNSQNLPLFDVSSLIIDENNTK